MTDYKPQIKAYLDREIALLEKLDTDMINTALNAILKAYEAGGTIYIFGNGGSASTASHFQNDFNKGISEYTEKKFNFLCLNDNVSTLMAVANDIGYDEVFRFQLRGKLKDGDLVIGISGSGNSRNVLNAAEYAHECGIPVLGITGYDGGKLKAMADVSLHCPIMNMQHTEDVHMIFDHLMMSVICEVWGLKSH